MSRRPLDLDFGRAQPGLSGRGGVAGVVLLLIALGAAAWVALEHRRIEAEATALEARVASLRTPRGATKTTEPITEPIALEIAFAGETLAQAAIPWRELFAAVESAREDGVALLALQPNGRKKELRIAGEAASFEALLAYRDRLAEAPMLDEVMLASHQVVNAAPARVVKFEISARWRP